MGRPAVLITSSVVERVAEARAYLTRHGFQVLDNPWGARIERAALASRLLETDVLIVGTQRLDEELLRGAPRLRVVVKAGAGLDNVDVAAAERRGIRVSATPGANAQAVADYTFGLLLAAARRIVVADRSVRTGEWGRYVGVDVHGKVLGVVGLGAIGRGVVRRARGFDMQVVAHDVVYDEEFLHRHEVRPASLDALLETADFVTLHVPLTTETHHLIDAERLRRMKPTAILVNTARGGLVDEQALYEALVQGRLAGAALDVFEQEPPAASPLLNLDNVVVSPHNASYTVESMHAVALAAVQTARQLWESVRA